MKHDYEWHFSTDTLGSREKPITTRQLAKHLQVSTRCLAIWRKKNLIPYWRLTARALRYNLSAVEAALKKPEWPNE
jgi:predicted site-specific integrase-resolvase